MLSCYDIIVGSKLYLFPNTSKLIIKLKNNVYIKIKYTYCN